MAADVELEAENPAAAERESRRGCEIFREMGETGRFSTLVVQLADSLYALDRDDEALRATEEGEAATSKDDLVSQVDWRRVRAKILARRGEIAAAEEMVWEAHRLAETSEDDLHLHAKVSTDVAEALRLAGRLAKAVPHAQRALELQERKGNIAGAARASALLEELAGGA